VGLGTGTGASVESVDGPGTAARGQLMVDVDDGERGGGNEIGERQREGAAADTDEKKR